MITMTVAECAALFDQSNRNEAIFKGISIDSRKLAAGNLFVALQGETYDGHDYLNVALEKGAKAALVNRKIDCELPQIIVSDTVLALGKLASHWRNQFDLPIVAVTGSNGKTTTKNLIAAILRQAVHDTSYQVLATEGTLNNHL